MSRPRKSACDNLTKSMSKITFRKVLVDDADKYIEVEKKVSGNYMYGSITNKEKVIEEIENNEVYFIQKDGEIIGSLEYVIKAPGEAYMGGLIVDPKYQGQGIARQAIEFRLDKTKDANRLWLTTHPHNSKIIKLYLSYGFKIEAWKDNYYGDGEPRLILGLNR